jgi:predicted nucleotidyltransferase component of viral defense system
MLSLPEILQFYPPGLRDSKAFLLREYLQCKILGILFNSPFALKFAFLGGTCIRLIHQSGRFSEDLDFDNFDLTKSDFGEVADLIKAELELEGLQVEMRNVLKGAYHCYIRFPNLLFEAGLTGHREEKILIQLDTEPQHFNFTPERVTFNRFDVFTTIRTTPPDILLAQKISAIFNRKRPKGRDFFDVTFLLAKAKPNFDYLSQKLGIETPDQLRYQLAEKVSSIDMEAATRDAMPFLFNPQDRFRILHFQDFIQNADLSP